MKITRGKQQDKRGVSDMPTYREEVIEPGDLASKLAKQVNRDSYRNCDAIRVIDEVDPSGFRNPVGFVWREHILREMLEQRADEGEWQIAETPEGDGNGQKPNFATLVGTPEAFYGQARDLIAMNDDDLARSGRFGVMMASNEVNVKRATKDNFHLIKALFDGLADGLRQTHLASITGEFAVMKWSITAFCDANSDEQLLLTWGGTCLGLMRRDRLINNANIRPGMVIVGFWEAGQRCNGNGRLIQIVREVFGPDPGGLLKNERAREFVRKLTIPSRTYAKALNRVQGWLPDGSVTEPIVPIVGSAHITGGGLWGKFGEALPEGVGAKLDRMPQPPRVLVEAQGLSRLTASPMSDWECYDTFHGACGMMVVVPDEYSAERLITEVAKDGIAAHIVGTTVESAERLLTVHSRFLDGGILRSDEPPKK